MKTDLNELRQQIAALYPKRAIGDLRERDFQALVADKTVALYRALIKERMAEGETMECEHHTIRTHFRLIRSVLREPVQQATSFFLTDRKLYRLRATLTLDRPATGDSRDQTVVDDFRLDRLQALQKKSKIRLGEVALGVAFFTIAVVFHDLLSITATFLAGVGILGALHGLLGRTRWMEVVFGNGSTPTEPVLIYAIKKDSGKKLIRRLQEKLRPSCLP